MIVNEAFVFVLSVTGESMAVGMSVIGVRSRFVSDVPNLNSSKSNAKILLLNCKSHSTNLLLLPI